MHLIKLFVSEFNVYSQGSANLIRDRGLIYPWLDTLLLPMYWYQELRFFQKNQIIFKKYTLWLYLCYLYRGFLEIFHSPWLWARTGTSRQFDSCLLQIFHNCVQTSLKQKNFQIILHMINLNSSDLTPAEWTNRKPIFQGIKIQFSSLPFDLCWATGWCFS